MRHIKTKYLFENSVTSVEIDEALYMGWLYFLYLYIKNTDGLIKKNWATDTRMMGIRCKDAMEEGIEKGHVQDLPDRWKITKEGLIVMNDFFHADTETAAKVLGDKLMRPYKEQYEKSKRDHKFLFSIDHIPYSLYVDRREARRKSTFKRTLTNEDYSKIHKFLEKYQRDADIFTGGMKKYAGKIDELCEDQEYVLYRGINYHRFPERFNFKVGDKLPSTRDVQSWSLSEDVALQFAYGNPTPMQTTLSKHRFPEGKGLILKHTFKPADVIMDFVYIDEANKNLSINWPEEQEVLIKCKMGAPFEVYKIV